MSKELSTKQKRFVEEYLVDPNATQAAIKAGYKPTHADRTGPKMLGNVGIQAAIEIGRKAMAARCEIKADELTMQYKRLGFSDPRKMFAADGTPKGIHELDDDTAASIAGFEVEQDIEETETAKGKKVKTVTRTMKVKFADKKGALDSLGKRIGYSVDGTDAAVAVVKVYLGAFSPENDL